MADTRRITYNLPTSLIAAVGTRAKKDGVAKVEVIRVALEKHLGVKSSAKSGARKTAKKTGRKTSRKRTSRKKSGNGNGSKKVTPPSEAPASS